MPNDRVGPVMPNDRVGPVSPRFMGNLIALDFLPELVLSQNPHIVFIGQ